VFVAPETARMPREDTYTASIAWATEEELTPETKAQSQLDQRGEEAYPGTAAVSRRRTGTPHRQQISPAPGGRTWRPAKKLDRSEDQASIAVAVAKDRAVHLARKALQLYLRGGYLRSKTPPGRSSTRW
jgi:hypothetical protein